MYTCQADKRKSEKTPAFAKAGIAKIVTTIYSTLSSIIFQQEPFFEKRAFPGIFER